MINIKKDKDKDKDKNTKKLNNSTKLEFLKFLKDNKKDLKTGFGAFHTDSHSMW